MSTISGSHLHGVVLTTASYTNPVTIASGAYILNASGDAVLGQSIAWTVVNNGFVHADGTNNTGIDLAAGGIVKNVVGAEILGDAGANGVEITGTGGVQNYGSIAASHAGIVLSSGDFV